MKPLLRRDDHRRYRRTVATIAVVMATFTLLLPHAWSQAPRTIKLIAPFPPGGSVDVLARLLGEQISNANGATVLVENRPGAGASIAYEAAARAAPDGNTLVINANSIVINPILRKVGYDPLASFEPICLLVRSPLVLAVNSASPLRSLNDLLAAARAKPGELSFASVGPATTQHIGFEQFRRLARVDLTYVPYSGGAPAVNALLGAHVTAVLANYSEVVEQLKAGSLRPLATSSLERIPPLPDVPTVAEILGDRAFEAEVWFGVAAPAGTPKPVIAQLAEWFIAAMAADAVKPKLLALGLYSVGVCGDGFAAHIRRQQEQYARIIRAANMKAE
jgi:tripartite-type tricarboxylate transporter receptor subunit TctC